MNNNVQKNPPPAHIVARIPASATLVAFVLAASIAAVALRYFGADALAFIDAAMIDARHAHIELPVAIFLFCTTAYIGAPQTVLIAACVFAFGAVEGFWYAWIATIASGALTFQTGRWNRRLALSGEIATRLRDLVRRNAFLASFLARFIPGPPFIVVNVALAAAGSRFWPYIAGLAMGSLPKTLLIAFAGGSLSKALHGQFLTAAALCAAIIVCIAIIAAIKRLTPSGAIQRIG